MAILQTKIAAATAAIIRATSYVFLRFALHPLIPAIVYALLAINIPATILSYLNEPKYQLVDEIDVVITDTIVKEDDDDDEDAEGEDETAPLVEVEEVEIQETLAMEEVELSPWKTILLGIPNPRSLALTAATTLLNLACVGMVSDRLFREHYYTGEDLSFVRVGYVSDTEAKLLIREPDQAKMPVTISIHIKDPQAPFDNPLWQTAGGVRFTTNETDYTAVVSVPLRHSKQRTYEWTTSNNHSGQFTAPPRIGHVSDAPDGNFTFLSTSCILNRLPYNPLDHPLSITGMRYLADVLPNLGAQFMLFLGDFIYADVPRYWGKEIKDYRQKYRQVYASPEWPTVGQNLSWIHVLDDHEILNDWSDNITGPYYAAVDPWHHYHTAANPPLAKQSGGLTARHGATYFDFTQGPASFFLLDTRSYRSPNSLPYDDPNKTMLGAGQLEDFLAFLARPEPRGVKWKFVASSVPFTKNWPINTKDTWGGFLVERRRVLEAMWDAGKRGYGVVILSGDRHEFAATKFPPPEEGPDSKRWSQDVTVHEFSASPLSQFYGPVPTYRQTDKEDVMIKYINIGQSKFGALTIGHPDSEGDSNLHYRLFVNGLESWDMNVTSPKATVSESTGSLLSKVLFGQFR